MMFVDNKYYSENERYTRRIKLRILIRKLHNEGLTESEIRLYHELLGVPFDVQMLVPHKLLYDEL